MIPFFNFSWFAILFVFMMFMVIPLLIGIFVFRDAQSRGMNAMLWALIAVLAPTYIGLLMYLFIRNDYSNLQCPTCRYSIQPSFAACPSCGTKLKHSCDQCGHPIQSDWKVCPSCASSLAYQTPIQEPERHKESSSNVLLLVLLIPLGFVGLMLVVFLVRFFFLKMGI